MVIFFLHPKGEPPSEEIEREWNRMMEAEEKLKDKSRQQMVSCFHFLKSLHNLNK